MNLKELQAQREKLVGEMRALDKEKGANWNEEAKAEWTRINEAYDKVVADIDAAVEREKREARIREAEEASKRVANNPHEIGNTSRTLGGSDEDPDLFLRRALSGWAKGKFATEEERQAAQEVGLWGADTIELQPLDTRSVAEVQDALCGCDMHQARAIVRDKLKSRALSTVSNIYGAYAVNPSLQAALEVNMLAFGSVLQAARIVQTTGGELWSVPTFDPTAMTASRVGENTDHGSATDPTFGKTSWSAYTYTTGVLKVPNNAFTDLAFDVDSLIGAALGEALARKIETDLTTGDGAAKPYGIVTAATLGKTTAGATAITFEEVMDLQQSVDRAYRDAGSFMMSDDVLHYVRKLKDSEGRFMWVNGIAPGLPDTLLGKRVFVNMAMAGFTSGALVTKTKTMLYGDMSKYIVRRAGGVKLVRMAERYAEYDQTGYLAMIRIDGGILSAGTAPIKYMAQA